MLKEKIKTIKEFTKFIKERNLWYLLPIFLAFLVVTLIIVLAESTPIWPAIYTIF